MLKDLIHSTQYKDFTSKQIKELIEFLVEQNEEFNLTANIQGVDFNPDIPQTISEHFGQFTLFTLANYTYQSLQIFDDCVTFEAGFGSENFGSLCTIPYYAIFQISIDNSILFINPSATIEKHFLPEIDEEEQKKRSMNALRFNR